MLVESGIVAFGIGIQLKKSGIPQTIGIWIQVPLTRNSESTAENLESKTVLDYLTWSYTGRHVGRRTTQRASY